MTLEVRVCTLMMTSESDEFNDDVGQVREHMIQILWDCYNDNIEDVVIEELGSDFKNTI